MKRLNTARHGRGGARRSLAMPALAMTLMLPLAACDIDEILDVPDPDVAIPGSVADSTSLNGFYGGAFAEFAQAYAGSGNTGGGGGNEGQILLSGLLGDEFRAGDTFSTRIEIDQRNILTAGDRGTASNGQLEDAERNLHRARRAAEVAAERFAALGQGNSPRRSELFSLAGYSYIFFGENYCEGVTFSSFPFGGGPPEFGAPTSRDQVFNLAIARFDSAIAVAGNNVREANLARVGKARALLNLNRRAEAAQVAAQVTGESFVYNVLYSNNTTGQENGVYEYANLNGRYIVSDMEAGEGLPYRSANDPRVPFTAFNRTPFDAQLGAPYFAQTKYNDRGADIPLATATEARLIQAEAVLNGGASADYLPILNSIRANANLTALTDPGTAEGRLRQFFQERAFFLWLTSHRLGDMRRLVRQYNQPVNTVFPSGEFFRGGTYGSDTNLPIFVDEGNNPNFTGCINRNP